MIDLPHRHQIAHPVAQHGKTDHQLLRARPAVGGERLVRQGPGPHAQAAGDRRELAGVIGAALPLQPGSVTALFQMQGLEQFRRGVEIALDQPQEDVLRPEGDREVGDDREDSEHEQEGGGEIGNEGEAVVLRIPDLGQHREKGEPEGPAHALLRRVADPADRKGRDEDRRGEAGEPGKVRHHQNVDAAAEEDRDDCRFRQASHGQCRCNHHQHADGCRRRDQDDRGRNRRDVDGGEKGKPERCEDPERGADALRVRQPRRRLALRRRQARCGRQATQVGDGDQQVPGGLLDLEQPAAGLAERGAVECRHLVGPYLFERQRDRPGCGIRVAPREQIRGRFKPAKDLGQGGRKSGHAGERLRSFKFRKPEPPSLQPVHNGPDRDDPAAPGGPGLGDLETVERRRIESPEKPGLPERGLAQCPG